MNSDQGSTNYVREGEIPVLVTTERRGIFFGYARAEEVARVPETKAITLRDCRNAWYYKTGSGFLGLASVGPQKGSKIGAKAEQSTFTGVTSVSRCTPAAVEAWESSQWVK